MALPQDIPTVGERYGVAVGAGTSGADVVIAAGLQRHALGATLLRLQSEYDTVRSEMERAGEIAERHEADARRLDRRDTDEGTSLAQALRARTEVEVLTARCIILIHLKTLRQAKIDFGAYAIVAAKKHGFKVPPGVVLRLAGRVLDVWLDPTCAPCGGTGWLASGYEGRVSKQCDRCQGAGHRRDSVGGDGRNHWFAFLLLGDIQIEVARAAKGMRDKLRPA